ncbi:uncharacterized protein ACBT57_013571 isoform 2-T2 [Dama dama]
MNNVGNHMEVYIVQKCNNSLIDAMVFEHCSLYSQNTTLRSNFGKRPERTVGELRKTFELQKTIRPQRKNDDHGKVFEVQHHTGTGCKSYVLHLGVDQNRNIPNQEPQERNVSFSEKTPVKSVKGEQDIDKLQIKIDDLQKKIGDLLKIVALSDHLPRLQYNLQKQIGDLLKNLEKSPKKDDDFQKKFEEISTTIGDLLRKLDKGEQDRDDLLKNLDKDEQDRDDPGKSLEDLLKAADKDEQDRGDLRRKHRERRRKLCDLRRKHHELENGLDKDEQDRDDLRKSVDELENGLEELLKAADKIEQEKKIRFHRKSRQVLGPGALGRPRGIGWRGWEGGSGWGIHATPWLIHVSV